MGRLWIGPWIALLVLFAPVAPASGFQDLRVATKASPPFAFQDAGGAWVGISLDLWDEVARRLDREYELVEVTGVEDVLSGVHEGRFDVGIAAITVTGEREKRVDFSHPYFTTGLGVAVRGDSSPGLMRILRRLLSTEFVTLVGTVVVALLLAGYLFWRFEKRPNTAFPDERRRGVSQGLWWSLVMFLGHKGIFPASLRGRLLAATCMVLSILLLSVLTGAIASVLTVGHFEVLVRDDSDLRHVRTLAVAESSGADYLRRRRIGFETVPSVAFGLEAVAGDRGDALVHDAPLLEYEVAERHARGLRVLPQKFALQDYAVVLPQGSPLREDINGALLELRSDPVWERIQYLYLQR